MLVIKNILGILVIVNYTGDQKCTSSIFLTEKKILIEIRVLILKMFLEIL